MPKQVSTQQSSDRQVNALQGSIAAATQQLRDGPFGDGVLQENLAFKNGVSTKVNTLLGRPIRGWVVVRFQSQQLGGAIVETASDDTSVTFKCYGDTTASIWFW